MEAIRGRLLLEGSYYYREATIRGKLPSERENIRGRLLLEEDYY